MKWLTNVYDFRFKGTATAAIGIHPTKTWLSQLVNFKNAVWHFRRTICNKLCFKFGKNDARETYGMLQTAFGAFCMNRASVFEWHKRFKEGRDSLRNDERCGKSIDHSWLAKGLGLLCWGFKGVQEEIPSEEASTLQIGSTRTIHLSTTPSFSKIIWPWWVSRQFLTLPIVQTLLSVNFAYSQNAEGVGMR